MSTDPRTEVMSNGLNFSENTHSDTYPTIDPTKANLQGRNVFITGASKGIGRATAISYAKAGASGIAIGARGDLSSLEQEIKAAAKAAGKPEPRVVSCKLDVTDRKNVDEVAITIRSALTHIDFLINNAGILETFTPILESDPDVWWGTYETNIKGVYLVTRAFLPLLLASPNKEKTVLSLSSIGAHLMSAGASSYQSGKLALLRLMEFVDVELSDKGILAYAIHPGGVMTEMGFKLPKEMQHFIKDTPELSGDSIVFLTKERREWLAGRYVSCSWDMDEFLAKRAEIEKKDLLKVRMVVD